MVLAVNCLFGQDTVRSRTGLSNDISAGTQRPTTTIRKVTDQSVAARTAFFVTDPDKQGYFAFDPADKSSPDDSAMILVTENGLRFKRMVDNGTINARWFGATGNGSTDDWYPLQKAINYILKNGNGPRTLYLPPGAYKITRPLIIARLDGNAYRQSSINLVGPANSKSLGTGAARIVAAFNNTFAIGIQLGKGVLIRDLGINGKFNFPDNLTHIQVDTLTAAEWQDGITRQNPLSPYSGIAIDPFSDSSVYPRNTDMYPGLHNYYPGGLGRGGSTAIQIVGCSIRDFVVGVMITPSDQQNADLIDVLDCDISYNKVAYAMGQAQSKECHVQRLKCWGATHTVFDNSSYGFRHGDGANIPMVDGANIAGAVKQLCVIYAGSFNGSFRNVYAERLFRIGYVAGAATVTFEDCQLGFSSQEAGIPYPDFFIYGSGVTFRGCMLRLYPGVPGARLVLSGTNNLYEGGITNAPPVAINIENNGVYQNPIFKNVGMYYSAGVLGNSNLGAITGAPCFQGYNGGSINPVYSGNTMLFKDPYGGVDVTYKFTYQGTYERTAALSGQPLIHTNKTNWTAWFKLVNAVDTTVLRPGDFILTSGLHYLDQCTNLYAPTYPVGFIRRIGHDTVYLDNLAVGIEEGRRLSLWMDYYVYEKPPFTGNIADKSNTVTNVQGIFPAIGDRVDIPMLPSGSYVKAVDQRMRTITFSNGNNTGRSFSDYTFMNGNPAVEIYSSFSPPELVRSNKTLIGGADLYQYAFRNVNFRPTDNYIPTLFSHTYKIINTNISGDTSLHKLQFVELSGSGAKAGNTGSPSFIINPVATGITARIGSNGATAEVTVIAGGAAHGDLVSIRPEGGSGSISPAVVSCGNAFTAASSSNLYCGTDGKGGLVLGGNLQTKGVYVFTIHLGL